MTDQRPDHARFDELAAGYALGALEPEDEWQFRDHASQCHRCREALDDYTAVAAALAEAAPDVQPDPLLRARILTAAQSSPQQADEFAPRPARLAFSAEPDGTPAAGQEPDDEDSARPAGTPLAPVVDLRSRTRARRLKIATAAAAVLVAGAGTWGGLAAAGGGQPPPAAGCVAASQCTQVILTAAAGHQVVAGRVVVQGRAVWLRPAALPANDTASQIYVLWQLTGKHTPLAVGSFDVRSGSHTAIRIGTLAAPYQGTLAFAVSLEHGRTIPASPTRQVALGQAPAPPDRISRPN